jgi:hypothetical protein
MASQTPVHSRRVSTTCEMRETSSARMPTPPAETAWTSDNGPKRSAAM